MAMRIQISGYDRIASMQRRVIRIEIIEDDPVAQDLLREYLKTEETEVAAIYTSGEEALEEMGQSKELPTVVLMDIKLPGISGIETARRLKAKYPSLEIIMLTIHEDDATIMQAVEAGASGYVLKGSPKEELLTALREATQGGSFLTGKIARRILHNFPRSENNAGGKAFGLTGREEEILKELTLGHSYKEIADKLNLSFFTVNNHIRKIYEKMRVHSRGEAAAKIRYS
jgi:DNA-binding NarL/FixJ family response regulator